MVMEKEAIEKRKAVNRKKNTNNKNHPFVDTSVGKIDNKINVHAPIGMQKVIEATKHFMRFETSGIKFNVTEYGCYDQLQPKDDCYKDEEMTVHPIAVYDTQSGKSIRQFYSSENFVDSINVSPICSPPFLCYACHMKPMPGKFSKEKAKKLGLPHNKLRAQLMEGMTVTLENGQQVKPEDVIDAQQPGPIFLIIDCPSESYIPNLSNNTTLNKYLSSAEEQPDLVLHLTKQNVCDVASYQEWIKRFPMATKHIFLDQLKQEKVVFKSQHNIQSMLNYIHATYFPLLAQPEQSIKLTAGKEKVVNFSKINLRELVGQTTGYIDNDSTFNDDSNSITLLAKVKELLHTKNEEKNIDCDSKVIKLLDTCHSGDKLDKTEHVSNTCENENREEQVQQSIETDKVKHNDCENVLSSNKRPATEQYDPSPCKKIAISNASGNSEICFPKVTCLGTGAAIPSKYRNVSATLVFLSEESAVLLDCGEDTYGQLCRHYGDSVKSVLSKIKMVLISHMHADHHLGVTTIIRHYETIKQEGGEPLMIVGPNLLSNWLSQYAETSETLNFHFVACENLLGGSQLQEDMFIQSVKVYHPGSAYGFVVKSGRNMKITYSGDTLPCEALVKAGMNSTLLIHEATLEDEMVEDALSRKHSTTSQALKVAQDMNAQSILLTHFSQRYPKMPTLKSTKLKRHTAIAFDHMEISIKDISKFHEIVPKLSLLFDIMENEKAEKNEE